MEQDELIRKREYRELQTLFASGNMVEVIAEAKKLIKKYNTAFAWNVLGLAYKRMGEVTQAMSLYEQLLKENENTLFLSNLGNIYYDLGRVSEAEGLYQRTLSIEPHHYNATISLANLYSSLQKYDQSLALLNSLEKVTAEVDSDRMSDVNYRIAENYRNKGEAYFDMAIEHYRGSTKPLSSAHMLECIYKIKDKEKYLEESEVINERGESNPLLGAIQTHAAIRYGIPDHNLFCSEPFRYITKSSLLNVSSFDHSLKRNLIKIKDTLESTPQPLLNGGSQSSGNIFSSDTSCIKIIKKIIEEKISEYRQLHQSGAMFLKEWPEKHVLHGWFISLKSGGALNSHMHKQGWLSGSIYLSLEKQANSSAGNIVFSLDGGGYPNGQKQYPTKELDIREGDIVLFPSSIFHCTLPVTSDRSRITLAFDLKPVYE